MKINLRMLLAQCTAKTSNIMRLVQPAGRPVRGAIFKNYRAVLPPVWRSMAARAWKAILDDVVEHWIREALSPWQSDMRNLLMM